MHAARIIQQRRRLSFRSKPRQPSSVPFTQEGHTRATGPISGATHCVFTISADNLCRCESCFLGSCSGSDIRQLTCKARLLDLFRLAPSVHTHLHKAQRHVEPRYGRSHSWHNKSRAGSMFALSPRHIPFAGDISQWLRDFFFLVGFQHSHLNSYLLLKGIFVSFHFLFFLATCRRSPVGCCSQCLQQRAT